MDIISPVRDAAAKSADAAMQLIVCAEALAAELQKSEADVAELVQKMDQLRVTENKLARVHASLIETQQALADAKTAYDAFKASLPV